MNIQNYQQNQPKLDLFNYFNGKTRGWGIFQDRSGNLKRQFVVDINGYINEAGKLVLEEYFVWHDGEESTREWTISKSDNHYTGTAGDVFGKANGETAGNAFHWRYVMKLPVGDKVYKVSFDDWLFLQPNGVLLNHAKMTKFGFSVGEVFISFKKEQF